MLLQHLEDFKMELTLKHTKEERSWLSLFLKPTRYVTSYEISEINHQSFKKIISDLRKLNKDSIIDDKQFQDILMFVCTTYIENEVEARVSKKFSEKLLNIFDKI